MKTLLTLEPRPSGDVWLHINPKMGSPAKINMTKILLGDRPKEWRAILSSIQNACLEQTQNKEQNHGN